MCEHNAAQQPAGSNDAPERGTSLVEALIALFLIAMVMLSIGQLIAVTMAVHKSSEDITEATALAEHKLEDLRNVDYDALAAGGSVAADVAGFFDTQDIDNDGTDEYRRRWVVTDNGDSKTIQVFVQSMFNTVGPPKTATMFALVADS